VTWSYDRNLEVSMSIGVALSIIALLISFWSLWISRSVSKKQSTLLDLQKIDLERKNKSDASVKFYPRIIKNGSTRWFILKKVGLIAAREVNFSAFSIPDGDEVGYPEGDSNNPFPVEVFTSGSEVRRMMYAHHVSQVKIQITWTDPDGKSRLVDFTRSF
jgi:hypothetical protein